MALTVDTLLAAMRTVRALHLHCRRIVPQSSIFAGERREAPKPTGKSDRASLDSFDSWDKVALTVQKN